MYVEAPNEWSFDDAVAAPVSVFLAGGITGCPDWQREVAAKLEGANLTVLNPRRTNFPIDDPSAAYAQIRWEHDYLRIADVVAFWFPSEALCPIALYELGAWSMTKKPLVVGVHQEYVRRQDVEVQTALVRPNLTIVYSLDALVEQLLATAVGVLPTT